MWAFFLSWISFKDAALANIMVPWLPRYSPVGQDAILQKLANIMAPWLQYYSNGNLDAITFAKTCKHNSTLDTMLFQWEPERNYLAKNLLTQWHPGSYVIPIGAKSAITFTSFWNLSELNSILFICDCQHTCQIKRIAN